jgi:hypothetical protein
MMQNNTTTTPITTTMPITQTQSMVSIEINGQKYLLCKLPDQPLSTLHDPDTKEIVGQWNNHTAQHEIFATESEATEGNPEKDAVAFGPTPTMTPQQFDDHIQELIASGAAFTII